MKRILLDGKYRLYTYDCKNAPAEPALVAGEYIDATVPGNVELDFMSAGIFPDLYRENNIRKAETLEKKDFWYIKEFDMDEPLGNRNRLVFEGVDTMGEYFLNGEKLGESCNAFVPHSFVVDGILKTGKNILAVHIRSALEYAKRYKISPYNVAFDGCIESLNVRKSAASYGWDILPRTVSAGIWRSVRLELLSDSEIADVYIATARAEKDIAVLVVTINADIPDKYSGKCVLSVSGKCGESEFEYNYPLSFNACTVYPYVKSPKLWFPSGAGKPNLYDINFTISANGKVLAKKRLRYGIRNVEVKFSDLIGEKGNFGVYVNGKLIRVRGVNHTPIDVFHSKDRQRIAEIAENISQLNCNFVRIWGGGVYENDAFYDLCDEKGIMVWQDIMLACHAYPQTDEFLEKMKAECEAVALGLRNHPSLILWCGSNETDWAYVCTGLDPNGDKVTRGVIKDALFEKDPYRGYLPSTPYFSEEFIKRRGGIFYLDLDEIAEAHQPLPEEHYWWHRDDFKKFPVGRHCFITEIGYSGSDSLQAIDRFLPEGWDFTDGGKWDCHSYPTETDRMTGIEYLFDNVSETNADRVAASRFYQAEAYKFIVEKSRIDPKLNGIVLWNLRDGFPIFSSSLIGYYGNVKPSYEAVKLSYEPVQCITDGGKVYIVNDSGYKGKAILRLKDVEEKIFFEKELELDGSAVSETGEINRDDGEIVFSELQIGNRKIRNYTYFYSKKINYIHYREYAEKLFGKV